MTNRWSKWAERAAELIERHLTGEPMPEHAARKLLDDYTIIGRGDNVLPLPSCRREGGIKRRLADWRAKVFP